MAQPLDSTFLAGFDLDPEEMEGLAQKLEQFRSSLSVNQRKYFDRLLMSSWEDAAKLLCRQIVAAEMQEYIAKRREQVKLLGGSCDCECE